jgi:hypothetical protein
MEVESLRRARRVLGAGLELFSGDLKIARFMTLAYRPEREVYEGCSEVVWGRPVACKKIKIWSLEVVLNRD